MLASAEPSNALKPIHQLGDDQRRAAMHSDFVVANGAGNMLDARQHTSDLLLLTRLVSKVVTSS